MQFLADLWLTNFWIRSLATLILFISIAQIVFGSMKFYLQRIEKLHKHTAEQLVKRLEVPVSALIIILGFNIASKYLPFWNDTLSSILLSAIIVACTTIIIVIIRIMFESWIRRFSERTGARTYDDEVLKLLEQIITIFVVAICLILILKAWGISIGPFLASLGIIGIAVGFAMQKTLGDVLGGIALVLDKCFRINDLIELESGEIGTVVDVGMRSTKVLTIDNQLLIIPNGTLSNMRIINYAKPNDMIRLRIPVDVVYSADPQKVQDIILGSVQNIDFVVKEPVTQVWLDKLADYSLHFVIAAYIDDYRGWFRKKTEIIKKVYADLSEAGIDIAYPTQTILLEGEKKKKAPPKAAKRKGAGRR